MKWSLVTRLLEEKIKEKGLEFESRLCGAEDPDVCDVFSDSRKVSRRSVFCCVKGERSDGHGYIAEAVKRGAAALVCERGAGRDVNVSVPFILVRSAREVMGELASIVYGGPSSGLFTVGVTGTNGKSTTTYILRAILREAGVKTGLLGTIIESDGATERDAERTTPESPEIQKHMSNMLKNACGACVMETSSHGLYIGRLSGALFDAAVFTNLYPEHLDFHKDMENYFQAKRLLFAKHLKADPLVAINADDPYGLRLLKEFGSARGFSVSRSDTQISDIAALADRLHVASDINLSMNGAVFTVNAAGFPALSLKSPLIGMFNVYNALSAVTALRGKVCDEAIARGVAKIPQVPGRLERYEASNGAVCIVDFAHTPEALRSALSTVRSFCRGKLISVFGHGGGRYAQNRRSLGSVAAALADHIIITMDNPRDEDPKQIALSIAQGIEESETKASYEVILDRKEAIGAAMNIAGSGDAVVVSGKGPEKFLLIKNEKIPYSDAETIKELIEELIGELIEK
ncbi:UDP-N-acetylmuramoyl-L-alanyl-D-glutamate--2,6-diaminopimelate ligase 1 [Synergistales bacterium]|nr:UDP-N-acetylmuramoyl-L-alanyl-D-glutamate--2,6-diaminopimelate ligase 1 [Synergistales bacterium]